MDSRTKNENPLAKHGRDLTKGSIPRQLIMFSVPLLIGNIIQAAYSIVNRYWVGQRLGGESLSAVTNTMQVIFILLAVANGLTLGSGILVSQFVGSRNWDGVKRVVQNSITLSLIMAAVLLVVGQLLTVPLLRAIKTPPEVWPIAVSYMRISLISFPFMLVAFLTAFLLRGAGDPVTPLIFQCVGVVFTAILDPFLMLGWAGLPRLGLNGTAVATLIAQAITIAAFFIYLHKKKHPMNPDWKKLGIDKDIAKVMLKISLPSAAQQLLVAMGTAAVLVFINEYGEKASAAFGAAIQIDTVALFLAMAFSMAVSTVAGQNIGAQKHDRVRQTFWWGVLFSGGSAALISVFAIAMPGSLASIFINRAHDPQVFQIAVGYLKIVGAGYILFAIMFAASGIINGSGHTIVSTFLTIAGLWAVRIPLAAYLSHKMHRVEGIWYAMVISFGVTMVLSLAYYFSGAWKKAVVRHTPSPSDVSTEDDASLGVIP